VSFDLDLKLNHAFESIFRLLRAHQRFGECTSLDIAAALNQPTFLTQAQALLGKTISEHTTQQNAEVKSIINKDRQVAPKRMQLGARLVVNTHNMGGCFVESVKMLGGYGFQGQVTAGDSSDKQGKMGAGYNNLRRKKKKQQCKVGREGEVL